MMRCLCLLLMFHFTAGCTLSGDNEGQEVKVTGHTGRSVLLSCSCTDLQTKPQSFIWWFNRVGWIDVFKGGHYRDRVQRFNEHSPGNLSLLISDLREEDEGNYRCQADSAFRDFEVHVTELQPELPTTPSSPTLQDQQTTYNLQLGLGILTTVLLLCFWIGAFFCWRGKGRRHGQNVADKEHPDLSEDQEDQTGTEVSYATIVHRNTSQAAHVQIITGEQSEYVSINVNQKHKDKD